MTFRSDPPKIVLQHRTMFPPLYIGEGSLVGNLSDAKTFRYHIDAEIFKSELGDFATLYTSTEVPSEAPPVTVSKNIRKTTAWKKVALRTQQALTECEESFRLSETNVDLQAQSLAKLREENREWQGRYDRAAGQVQENLRLAEKFAAEADTATRAHGRAVQSLYAMTALFVGTAILAAWGWAVR